MYKAIACPKCFSENLTMTLAARDNTCTCECGWVGKDVERVPRLFSLGFEYAPKEFICKFCKVKGSLIVYQDTMFRCLSCQRKWIEEGIDV